MSEFAARKPILDSERRLVAYEIFSQSGYESFYEQLPIICRGRAALIDFPHGLASKQVIDLFPGDAISFILRGSGTISESILQSCQALKAAGHKMYADLACLSMNYHTLIDVINVVQVAFDKVPEDKRRAIAEKFSEKGVELYATGIDTIGTFSLAKKLGYRQFQGYFFARPGAVSIKTVSPNKAQCLLLLKEVAGIDFNLDRVSTLIKNEVTLSYKLLSYINSAFFSLPQKVKDVRHALSLLGRETIRKWVSLLAMNIAAEDKPNELIVMSLTRASFFELLAPGLGLTDRSSDLFLLGMFSLLDAFLDQSMAEVLAGLPIDEDIKLALVEETGPLASAYALGRAYENGDWDKVGDLVADLPIEAEQMSAVFAQAAQIANATLKL